MKHSKSLDHLLVAASMFRKGQFSSAAEAMDKAVKEEDFEETVAELDRLQDVALDSTDVEMEEAKAAFKATASSKAGKGKKTVAEVEEEEDEEDEEEEAVGEAVVASAKRRLEKAQANKKALSRR